MAVKGQQFPADEDSHLYKTDAFHMFCFKVLPCSKRYVHDWTTCPFAHPGEKARRRDPRVHMYTGVACPEMKKNAPCPRGDSCTFAHNVFEYWLHPSRYRTQMCNDGVNCTRKICFFAHTPDELRQSSVKVLPPSEAAKHAAAAASAAPDILLDALDLGGDTAAGTHGVGGAPEPQSPLGDLWDTSASGSNAGTHPSRSSNTSNASRRSSTQLQHGGSTTSSGHLAPRAFPRGSMDNSRVWSKEMSQRQRQKQQQQQQQQRFSLEASRSQFAGTQHQQQQPQQQAQQQQRPQHERNSFDVAQLAHLHARGGGLSPGPGPGPGPGVHPSMSVPMGGWDGVAAAQHDAALAAALAHLQLGSASQGGLDGGGNAGGPASALLGPTPMQAQQALTQQVMVQQLLLQQALLQQQAAASQHSHLMHVLGGVPPSHGGMHDSGSGVAPPSFGAGGGVLAPPTIPTIAPASAGHAGGSAIAGGSGPLLTHASGPLPDYATSLSGLNDGDASNSGVSAVSGGGPVNDDIALLNTLTGGGSVGGLDSVSSGTSAAAAAAAAAFRSDSAGPSLGGGGIAASSSPRVSQPPLDVFGDASHGGVGKMPTLHEL